MSVLFGQLFLIKPVSGGFGTVVLLEETGISIKLCWIWNWTNMVTMSTWHGTPNHHHLWKLHTGQYFRFHSSSRHWQFVFQINLQKYFLKTLDNWAIVHFFIYLAQVGHFWHCLWFRSGFIVGMQHFYNFPKTYLCGGLSSTNSTLTPVMNLAACTVHITVRVKSL